MKVIGGDKVLCFEEVMGMEWNNMTTDFLAAHEIEQVVKDSKDRFLAASFIVSSDEGQFGNLKQLLKSNANMENDMYPWKILEAYELLLNTADILERRRNNTRIQRPTTTTNVI